MKEIKAIIRPFKALDVVLELQSLEGFPGLTISDVRGFGKSKARNAREKVIDGPVAYVHKVRLEIVVPDEMVDTVVQIIQMKAHTGNLGDGKIFIFPVEEVIKIRTNEKGIEAV